MIQIQAWKNLLHSICSLQFPLVVVYLAFFQLPAMLHHGFLSSEIARWTVASVLDFFDGFRLYFLHWFLGPSSAFPIFQCMELLGYPHPDLPRGLSLAEQPDLVRFYSVRFTMTLATIVPVLAVCWSVVWLLDEFAIPKPRRV